MSQSKHSYHCRRLCWQISHDSVEIIFLFSSPFSNMIISDKIRTETDIAYPAGEP